MKNKLPREKTKRIQIGNTFIGGTNNVLIQSMCNIKTERYKEVADQINRCEKLGADLMRVSVLDEKDAEAIKEIKKLINIPLIADIHFDYRLAIKSIESGADAVRLNPGNIGSKENIEKVVSLCKQKHIPIRIGVNSGSIDKEINNSTKSVRSNELNESAKRTVKILEDLEFYDIVISLKGSHVLETVEAYRLAKDAFNYPLHLGITEAGPKDIGLVRSVAGLAPILLEGIGDTIRISLSDEPEEEVRACRRLLKDLEIRTDYPTLISCPTCGRTQVNLVPLAEQVLNFLEENKINLTVAIMGCIVNGPGEAKRADIGCAGGKGQWVIFKKDKILKTVLEKDIYKELTSEILKMKS
ncbi:MAG: flavodoxin-dependent (E)-4-hydroxy-3-methylbut-2-enyl-diphosphate synthase [Bacilli bacterium]|nr:flavodoxin-dependent (E)-4-hydroxy-3-methylbut-2-enyl-diphosphate synthase [Bacilli bacterium]